MSYYIIYRAVLCYVTPRSHEVSSAASLSERLRKSLGGTTCLTLLVQYGLICFMRCL